MRVKGKYPSIAGLYIVALLIFCAVVPHFSTRSHAARDESLFVSTATRAGRLAVFDDVWETIQERYYDPTFRGIDWEASRVAFRPAAAEAKNSEDLYGLLRRMIAPLKDAHTRVFSPEEKFDWWNPKFVTIGVTLRDVEGKPTVVHVEPNSAAAKAGLRMGDVVINIDHVSSLELLARRVHEGNLSGSARLRAVRGLFEGAAGTPLTLTWRTKEGRTKSAVLERYWSQRTLGFRSYRSDGIAIINLDAFTQTIANDFLKQLPTMIGDARGIILDLRGNGGGDAEAMATIASAFLADGINLGKFADRTGSSFELVTTRRLSFLSTRTAAGRLPMIVLTNETSSSAAEILAATLQHQQRALVIGSTTCGCVLAIRHRHTLPDGGVLDVSEFDYRTAEGVRLEGVGVTPDQPITITRGDLYAKRDVALERAKKQLRG